MWRTIKINVQVGELILPKILQSEKSFADTSGEWNLILVDRNHYIPDNYQVELTELSNGKKVDSRIYPELQQINAYALYDCSTIRRTNIMEW